ncbi:DUF1684 domain-containing protein [Cesiribacter andamanensis]|nr:DUF1684 domain-containing protein [Cesiribacter andamanensis]
MSKRILGFLIISGIIAIFAYTLLQSNTGTEDPQQYQQRIQKEREQKNASFRSGRDSPIPQEARSSFQGLNYYPITPELRLQARLERMPQPEAIRIETSTGTAETYLRWGLAHFQLRNQSLQLLILQAIDDPSYLFIPFADETSARSTYGAGRYLEVEEPKGNSNRIELDFNRAYNPYCAYNEAYTCPLPPRDNLLPVPIEAGEKSYEK